MSVTNFSFVPYADGNTLTGADLNSVLNSIKSVFEQVIADNNSTPLLPVGYAGVNRIAAVINNSLIGVDANGNVVLTPKTNLDDAVSAAAASAVSAEGSAQQAQAAYQAVAATGAVPSIFINAHAVVNNFGGY